MGNAEIEAANEIYKTARADADIEMTKLRTETEEIREESKVIGVLQKISYDNAHNKMLKYAILYQVRQSKSYKKGGLTWETFCECIGEERRNVERILKDLKPVYDEFQDKLSSFINMPFNKIRYLGRAKTGQKACFENGCLVFDGEKIPITPENREEIEAAIDTIKDANKKEIEDSKTVIKAKDRVLQAKQKVIQQQEKELAKFNKEIENRDYEPGEKDFIKQMDAEKHVITGVFLKLDPERMRDDTSPLMTAKYIEVLAYIKRMAQSHYDMALETRAQPDDIKWQQPGLEAESEEQSNTDVVTLFGD